MKHNKVTATITFDFRGKTFNLSKRLDLDEYMNQWREIPSIPLMLANHHGIDTYSYKYEMMEVTTVYFDEPTGIVAEHVKERQLNQANFEKAWEEARALTRIKTIVRKNMQIDNLDTHTALKKTLLEIYHFVKAEK